MKWNLYMPKRSDLNKRNIAVIGSGTGLTAAWALESQKEFKVTVFEEADRLGGHIHSIKLNNVILEGGAEFIGPPSLYPNVHQLFNHLNVKLDPFELNMDFDDLNKKDHVVLPPLYHTSDGKDKSERTSCSLSVCGLFKIKRKQTVTRVSVNTILTELYNLLNMNDLINDAKQKILNSDQVMTLEEFVEIFKKECADFFTHREDFADEFLYPLVASGWGVPIEMIKKFCAHYAMNYLAAGKDWFDAPEGLSTYIEKMAAQCTNTQINLNSGIKKLVPIVVDGATKYHLLKKDDTLVMDDSGQAIVYDDVIITTPAYVTKELLTDVQDDAIKALKEKLNNVYYYDTTIVFHQDPAYRSPYNTVVHSRYDGTQSANTMTKPWKFEAGEVPVMKSWVLPGQPMPKNVLKEVHYRHPKMGIEYYEAQQALHTAQGIAGLWHGGILAGFNDSHESGVTADLQVAAKLNLEENCLEENERLALFPNILAPMPHSAIVKAALDEELEEDHIASSSRSFA